ncbi:MAG: GNAT family N-acetyltransferase [Candidatus Acidiferrales bacterium]
MKIRPAMGSDARAIHALIAHFATKELLLPRDLGDVASEIDTFIVCEDSRTVVGCLSLVEYHAGLAEIRSVAVEPTRASRGIGSRLVRRALKDAASRGIARVLAVTGTPGFFVRFGFRAAASASMSEKVERDCRGCAKAQACRLLPMILELETESALLPSAAAAALPLAPEC